VITRTGHILEAIRVKASSLTSEEKNALRENFCLRVEGDERRTLYMFPKKKKAEEETGIVDTTETAEGMTPVDMMVNSGIIVAIN
jgi:hypothetical protein